MTTPEGFRQRKFVYGKIREIVHDKWIKLQEQAKNRPIPTTMPTIQQCLTDWLRDVVTPNLAPSTAANYEMFTRLYIVPALGKRRLDKLTVREVQTWLNTIKKTCQCCKQGKDAARPETKRRCCAVGRCCGQLPLEWTVHQAWTVLRSGLSNAIRDGVITRNVAALVRVPIPRSPRGRRWTVDDLCLLICLVREFSAVAERRGGHAAGG
ncbi:MAG: hypothetical protein GXX79_20185 [Actinomycetales bacterium]|nr:hypothetical protein [Actinomycetales bacterium]